MISITTQRSLQHDLSRLSYLVDSIPFLGLSSVPSGQSNFHHQVWRASEIRWHRIRKVPEFEITISPTISFDLLFDLYNYDTKGGHLLDNRIRSSILSSISQTICHIHIPLNRHICTLNIIPRIHILHRRERRYQE